MFTGLVNGTAKITKIENLDDTGAMARYFVENKLQYKFELGDSIAINGCCLTAAEGSSAEIIVYDVSRETLAKTNLQHQRVGDSVNVEKAMQLQDRLDGHLVSGHVDTTAEVIALDEHPAGWLFKIKVAREFAKYMIPKGSICLNGVSLTINELFDEAKHSICELMLIPTTLEKTNLKDLKSGDVINVEFDLVGKYILRAQQLS